MGSREGKKRHIINVDGFLSGGEIKVVLLEVVERIFPWWRLLVSKREVS